MHNFRVYWTSLYMFRTVFPSIIRSSRLWTQHQVYVIQVSWLLANGHELEHLVPASKQSSNLYDLCTILNSWWGTERPSETCRVIFNKLENCASNWFSYRNISRRKVPWTWKLTKIIAVPQLHWVEFLGSWDSFFVHKMTLT